MSNKIEVDGKLYEVVKRNKEEQRKADAEWVELEDKEIVGECYSLYKELYTELCERIRGDGPKCTPEEVLEKLDEIYQKGALYQDVCEMLGMDSDCSHRELIEELEWAVKCSRFVTWKGNYDEVVFNLKKEN